MVFSITYIGNILNAMNMAKKMNSKDYDLYQSELRKSLFEELEF